MSTIESAMADTHQLSTYQGHPVLSVAVALTGAGDGLSKAMSVKPVELHIGDEVYVLTKAIVQKHRHEPIDKDDPGGPLRLVLMFKAGTMTIVDSDFASGKIADQERLIREAQERAKGIQPLPGVPEAERDAETGRKPVPAAPDMGDADADGFHDPALAAAQNASKAPAKKAAKPIGKAAAKLAAAPEASDG